MKCSNGKNDVSPKDEFCGHCGNITVSHDGDTSKYLGEIRQFSKDQEEAKSLEKFDDLDLNNPTGILKAQLRMLISIYRRLEKLENKEKEGLKVMVADFDMPFWSLVGFEFKVLLVGIFFMSIISCAGFLIFGSFLESFIRHLLNNIP